MRAWPGNGVYIMGFTPDQSISRVVSLRPFAGSEQLRCAGPDRLYGQRAAQAFAGRGPQVGRAGGLDGNL